MQTGGFWSTTARLLQIYKQVQLIPQQLLIDGGPLISWMVKKVLVLQNLLSENSVDVKNLPCLMKGICFEQSVNNFYLLVGKCEIKFIFPLCYINPRFDG